MFDLVISSNLLDKIPPLSEKFKTILKETKIDEDNPGTILSDWQTMLNLIGEDGLEVSKKQNTFPLKILQEINQKLTHPIVIDLKRPVQKSYPYIQGLYIVLRCSGMTRIVHQGSKCKIVINSDVLESWQKLNPTEQYFILLEIWLFWASEDLLEGYHHTPNFFKLQNLWQLVPDDGMKLTGKKQNSYHLDYHQNLVNLAMLHLLGIVELKQGKPLAGKGWRLTYLEKTDLGNALVELMIRSVINDSSLLSLERESHLIYGKLRPVLQEFFPEFKQELIINLSVNQEGIYVFKVSLEKAWRRISIPSDLTLEDLVDAILEAFDFDNEHLYRFVCQDRCGLPLEINHPDLEDLPYTTEFLVGQLPLEVGGRMVFEFDFGDNWQFSMLLEAINPPDPEQKETQLIASHGKAPSQYGWDDEDEEW